MSFLSNKEKSCTHCQFPNDVEIWSIVNVHEDPELKDLLLGGELNMSVCSSCQKVFYAEDFVIYHDPDTELMAFVYPYENRNEKDFFEQKTKDDFLISQGISAVVPKLSYEPITLFGLDELLTIVEWDDEAEIQSEIVKCLADELGFSSKRIHTAFSRANKIPPILPFTHDSGKPDLANILAALIRILQQNDRLNLYIEAQRKISEQPDMMIPYVTPEPV